MSYQAGDTYHAQVMIRDADGALVDPDELTLKVREPDGTVTTYDHPEDPIEHDSVGVFHADVLLEAAGMWVFAWATTNDAETEGVQVWVSESPTATVTFCTTADVATRLGRDLTDAETATVAMLCELVTGEITAAVDETTDWPATLEAIPSTLRTVALDVVTRAMHNPSGLSSTSETLGAYSYTERFASDDGSSVSSGFGLTAAEKRRVRRAVFGSSVATIEVGSIFESDLLLP